MTFRELTFQKTMTQERDMFSNFHLLFMKTQLSQFDQTLSIWLGVQLRQRYGHIAHRKPTKFLYIFDWQDPETKGLQELNLNWFKVHSWLTSG